MKATGPFGRLRAARLPRSWGSFLIVTALSTVQGTQLSLLVPLLDAQGYAPTLAGLLVSVTTVASLLSRVPAGLLYRRHHARRLQAVALTLLAGLVALHPLVGGFVALLTVRVLAGLAYGVTATVNLAHFVDEQPAGASRARAMGYYAMGLAAGYSMASLLVGFVVEGAGYVAAFALGAGLVLLGLVGLLDRTPPAAIPPPADGAPASPPSEPAAAAVGDGWAALLRVPALLVLALETLLLNALWAFWNAWLPLCALAVGLSLADAGLLRTVFGAANAAGRPLGGGAIMRLGAERIALVGLLVQCGLLLLVPALPLLAPLLAVFLVSGLLRAVSVVANTVAVVDRAEQHGLGRGTTAALFSTVTDLGLLAGPACGGLLVQLVGPVLGFVVGPLAVAALYLGAHLAVYVAPRRMAAGPGAR